MAKITFTIKSGGRIVADGDGFTGPVCDASIRGFFQSMSPSTEESSELHGEYHTEAVLEEELDG